MSADNNGKTAERAAALFYLLRGYKIIARNYITGRGTGAGEIDLIVSRGNLLVFVEVKKRSTLERAFDAVKPEQQQRIWKAAENFIATHQNHQDSDIRFDAFLFVSWRQFKHIPDAWRL